MRQGKYRAELRPDDEPVDGPSVRRPSLAAVLAKGPLMSICMMLLLGRAWNMTRVSAVSVWMAKMLPTVPPMSVPREVTLIAGAAEAEARNWGVR